MRIKGEAAVTRSSRIKSRFILAAQSRDMVTDRRQVNSDDFGTRTDVRLLE